MFVGNLRCSRPTNTVDRDVKGGSDSRVESGLGTAQLINGDPNTRRSHTIEAFGLIKESDAAAIADILNEGIDGINSRTDIARRPGHQGEQFSCRERASAQIEDSHHDALSLIAASLGNTRAWMRLHRP